jgi:hypothetical protein
VQPLWKAIWRFLKKLKPELPYGPAIPLLGILGIYPKECMSEYNSTTCTPLFIAALFTNFGSRPDAPQLMNELRKCGTQRKMKLYCLSVNKWNMLSKVSQGQKVKGHMFSFICGG